MALEAVGDGVQQPRAAAGCAPAPPVRPRRRRPRRRRCRPPAHPACPRPWRGPRHRGRPSSGAVGGGGRDAVVLADEEHRQLVHLGPVQAFQEGPAVGRAVAEEAGHDLRQAADLQRLRRAGGDGDARGHHAVGAQHADREVGNVHRAALALVGAAGPAEQLAHHARGVGALGQRVAVAAVGGREQVRALQVQAHARGHRFLAGGQVQRPAHLGRRVRRRQAPGRHAAQAGLLSRVFEGADAAHQRVQLQRTCR